MAGPAVEVHISQAVLDATPPAPDLRTPEAAIRSNLAWTSYAYRIGQSTVATDTMSGEYEVLVDSYIQLNLQQKRLLDQTLDSITFGAPSVTATSVVVPARERWTYSYLSIDTGNKALAGPYEASYDTTYTVVKSSVGWVVDSVQVKALGEVK